LPMLVLEGIEGKMILPMAQTVMFALAGAFILSLTYIPMMSSLMLSRKVNIAPDISGRIMQKAERMYLSSLTYFLRIPKLAIGAVLFLFIISLIIMSKLGGEFIPALEEGDFAVDTRVLTGSNLNTTIAFTQKAAKRLKDSFPE